jgi:hypothetical protein
MPGITINIRPGTYKFGLPEGNGWTLLFNESDCECCDCTIMAANSIKADLTLGMARRLDIKLVTFAPEEGGYSEEFGGETCIGCYDHTARCGDQDVAPAPVQKSIFWPNGASWMED